MDSCDSLDPTPEPIADESIERNKESESGLPSMLFDNMQSCFDLNYGTTHATKMDSYDSPSHTGDPTAKAAIDSDMVASSESQLSGPRNTTCDKFFHKVLIDEEELTVSTADLIWLWEQKAEG